MPLLRSRVGPRADLNSPRVRSLRASRRRLELVRIGWREWRPFSSGAHLSPRRKFVTSTPMPLLSAPPPLWRRGQTDQRVWHLVALLVAHDLT